MPVAEECLCQAHSSSQYTLPVVKTGRKIAAPDTAVACAWTGRRRREPFCSCTGERTAASQSRPAAIAAHDAMLGTCCDAHVCRGLRTRAQRCVPELDSVCRAYATASPFYPPGCVTAFGLRHAACSWQFALFEHAPSPGVQEWLRVPWQGRAAAAKVLGYSLRLRLAARCPISEQLGVLKPHACCNSCTSAAWHGSTSGDSQPQCTHVCALGLERNPTCVTRAARMRSNRGADLTWARPQVTRRVQLRRPSTLLSRRPRRLSQQQFV